MASLGFLSAPWHPLATMTPDEQKREAARLDYEALMSDAANRLQHQVDLGKVAVQSLTLVNGGAIVALFTLVGQQGIELALDPERLKLAFGFFVAGLFCSLASMFGGFLSQYWYSQTSIEEAWEKQSEMLGDKPKGRDFMRSYKRGSIALAVGLCLAVLSVVSFAAGSWAALSGFIA